MAIGLSHGGSNIYSSSTPAPEVLVGTTDGEVYWSEDGGAHWSLTLEGLGPISKKGHYRRVAREVAAGATG